VFSGEGVAVGDGVFSGVGVAAGGVAPQAMAVIATSVAILTRIICLWFDIVFSFNKRPDLMCLFGLCKQKSRRMINFMGMISERKKRLGFLNTYYTAGLHGSPPSSGQFSPWSGGQV
jgi:hypothetical protein